MSYILGLDVGASTTKGVLLDPSGEEIARAIEVTGVFFERASDAVRDRCCELADITPDEITYVAATGYGRYRVPFRQVQITEITCHARGAAGSGPPQLEIAPNGRVRSFRQNDKCASGSGRFLERVAKAMELDLSELGPRALQAHDPCEISSICAVLAESEVINLVSQEKPTEDILAGAHHAITGRVASLVKPLKPEPEITLTGGVVHNPAFVEALRASLNTSINVSLDNEFAGALGAGLLGRYRLSRPQRDRRRGPMRRASGRVTKREKVAP